MCSATGVKPMAPLPAPSFEHVFMAKDAHVHGPQHPSMHASTQTMPFLPPYVSVPPHVMPQHILFAPFGAASSAHAHATVASIPTLPLQMMNTHESFADSTSMAMLPLKSFNTLTTSDTAAVPSSAIPDHTSLKTTSGGSCAWKRRPGRPRKYSASVHQISKNGIQPRLTTSSLTISPSMAKQSLKSRLRPPKQPLTAWQLYFTDELRKLKAASPNMRLNVAQLAKDAGQRYASLPDDKRQQYLVRGQEARGQYEAALATWRAQLTPEEIRHENMIRTAKRRMGQSRRGNLRDPNAPKKPLSAYFLYLRSIRADPEQREDVLRGEHDTTKQSVLAAAKWRSLNADEKRPFVEQAEHDKRAYEQRRQAYEQSRTLSGS